MSQITFHYKDTYTIQNDLQRDIYQIIKLELGHYCEEKYEELMDTYALAKNTSEMEYYENYSQVVRRLKTTLLNTNITNLQNHVNTKRNDLKDGFVSPKQQKQRTISLDILDKWNQSVLQLVYDIMEEVKEHVLKKTDSCYEIIENYFLLNIKKKNDSFDDFVDKNYEYLDKTIRLVYGGYNYGKEY